MDIPQALSALEQLASSTSTSSSGPLTTLLDEHFTNAKTSLLSGQDPKTVITDLQKAVIKSKKDVEKGLKGWYGALGGLGKAVDKAFPPNLAAISKAYDHPALFAGPDASEALDRIVMDSLGRRGIWEAVSAMEEETGSIYDSNQRGLYEELDGIISAIEDGDVNPALAWCESNKTYLSSPPHPSPLPYNLHRSVFLSLSNPLEAVTYARQHLMMYLPSQPVSALITSCLYPSIPVTDSTTSDEMDLDLKNGNGNGNGNGEVKDDDRAEDDGEDDPMSNGDSKSKHNSYSNPYKTSQPQNESLQPLINLFISEFSRRHGLPKEDPLAIAVDLGSRGGALNDIEKARRVMGERLGSIRQWEELPMEVPLPPSRRYHSVFVCPVSKEQATDVNPPKILTCGHVLASESFGRLLKGGRRSAKCPYCPAETSQTAAQRLFF